MYECWKVYIIPQIAGHQWVPTGPWSLGPWSSGPLFIPTLQSTYFLATFWSAITGGNCSWSHMGEQLLGTSSMFGLTLKQNLRITNTIFKRGFCSAEECKLSSVRNWEQKKEKLRAKKKKKKKKKKRTSFLSQQSSFSHIISNKATAIEYLNLNVSVLLESLDLTALLEYLIWQNSVHKISKVVSRNPSRSATDKGATEVTTTGWLLLVQQPMSCHAETL